MKDTGIKGKALAAALAALAASAQAAYTITGQDSLAVGNMAGMDAHADRTVVIGTGAGAYMQGGDSNLFVGAAAGLRAANVKSSVGLGHYAFRGSTNMTRCVGIGDLAFAGRSGLDGATWVNGHFFANGGMFWIKPNRDTPDDQAPIYYNAGNLYLNAGKIITQDGTTFGSGGAAGDAGFDYYVSDAIGDDFNDGLSVGSAFKTLDRAFEAAGPHQTVGVLAGSYAYPTNYNHHVNSSDIGASKPVRMVSLSGADRTFVTTERPSGNPGYILGCFSSTWTYFEGFTFRGCTAYTKTSKDAFMATRFKDCTFTDMVTTNGNHGGTFEICILENCRVSGLRVTGTRGYGTGSNCNFNPHIFGDCCLVDCVVDFRSIAPGSNLSLAVGSRFENTFLTGDWVNAVDYWPHKSENFGVDSGFVNCTVGIATNMNPAGAYFVSAHPISDPIFAGCIVGIDGCTESASDSVVTNFATVAEAVGADTLRPKDDYFDWYFYGYGSRLERLTKDAIVRQVMRELAASATATAETRTAARAALARMPTAGQGAGASAPAIDFRADGRTLAAPADGPDE